jgi:hypothetical protein
MPKYDANAIEILEHDVIVFTGVEYKSQKRKDEIKTPERLQGRLIQDAIERRKEATVKQISLDANCSLERVAQHVRHSMKLKNPKVVVKLRP